MMEGGYRTFAEYFRDCCGAACTRLAYERGQTDAKYAVRVKECEKYYKLIEKKLGFEYKLIDRFDTAKNNVFAFHEALIYQQGFQDCVYLLQWLGLL